MRGFARIWQERKPRHNAAAISFTADFYSNSRFVIPTEVTEPYQHLRAMSAEASQRITLVR